MPNREDELIAWLRRQLGADDLLGDDAAVLPPLPAGGRTVATVDSQIAGVHHPADLDPAVVARRLLAVNLSDLAATGADPGHALLALSAPADYDHRRFLTGLLAACREHGVTLAGGDLARTEPAVASLTLLGLLPAGRRPLTRSAARPGHTLWVGGPLGESAAGRHLLAAPDAPPVNAAPELTDPAGDPAADSSVNAAPELTDPCDSPAAGAADPASRNAARNAVPELRSAWRRAVRRHLLPHPQLALGRALAERADTGAVMDLSDGLSTDLPRLCRASGVGAEVEAAALPLAEGFEGLCHHLGEDPRELALHGGEDYVLLFTLPPVSTPPAGHGCSAIGTVTAGTGVVLVSDTGRSPLSAAGWDHLA